MVYITMEWRMNYQNYYQQEYSFKQPDRSLDYFKAKFEAHITKSREFKYAVRDEPNYRFNATDAYTHSIRSEPCVAVHMPKERFERLIAQQDYIDRMESDANYGKELLRRQHDDRMVRESNDSVAKAYRNYQMLLELARK